MHSTTKSDRQCETVRTVSNVVTAACLLVITIGFLVAGTWTARTMQSLQSTYHPERLTSMIDTVADTLDSVHQTTFLLKSGKHVPLMDDLHRLVESLENLAVALQVLPVGKMVDESESWRLLSMHFLDGVKKSITDL
tara:strand:- start:111 stop:521 length:411 start_codon:yes stop_codon:yes gene_type:complete